MIDIIAERQKLERRLQALTDLQAAYAAVARLEADLGAGLTPAPAEPTTPAPEAVAKASRLSPERRSEIGRKGAAARWHKAPKVSESAPTKATRPYGVMTAKVRAALKDGPVTVAAMTAVHGCKVRQTLADLRRKGELECPSEGVYQLAGWTAPEPEAPPVPVVKAPTVNLSVSQHALDRYHEHYPQAGYGDLLADVQSGIAIEPDLGQTLAGRTQPPKNSRYVISSGRRGMFAIAVDVSPERVVTYLRFGAEQQAFVARNWRAP